MEIKEIILPKGWEVDRVNKIEDGKTSITIIDEVTTEFPETWRECCRSLGKGEYITNYSNIGFIKFHSHFDNLGERNMLPIGFGRKILAFCQLLVCREAYRKGWKPDWTDDRDQKYSIEYYNGQIIKNDYTMTSRVLSFETRRSRDAFFDNFKDLIEEAKELI